MSASVIDRLNAALEGRYRIERELGEGGMATVYLTRDLKHGRNVAIKVLNAELAALVGAKRFLAEIEMTAGLAHPHIVPLFDSGEVDGLLYFVDTWWQTETGGILITPLPGATPLKPGSATLPFFGIKPVLVDDNGARLANIEASGNLCLERTWPGQARTVWGDHERFHETYFTRFQGYYFTGDGCRRDRDGYYWITGRVDDVINVSGHRLGTAEIESALVEHESVAEAAVVGFPHPIKGQGIFAYVFLNDDVRGADSHELTGALKEQVRHVIGRFATPDTILMVEALPKTRSGKIMRRILRNIAAGEYENMGNVTTLADPSVVEALVEAHKKTVPG